MLRLKEEKHLIYYDDCRSYFASFTMQLERLAEPDDREKNNDLVIIKEKGRSLDKFSFEIRIKHQFKFEWQSKQFTLTQTNKGCSFGKCPFSL